MIKKFFFLAALALLFAACNNASKDGDDAMTVGQLLEQAQDLVDQTVMVEGTVTHVCKHGGKRLFIVDADGNEIKVESGEAIAQFDATLEGTDIIVEAIVRELRIDEAYLQEWEAELAAEAAAADTMMEEAETVVEEAVEAVEDAAAEVAEAAEEVVTEATGEEHMAEADHPEMDGKEDDHHMDDPYAKIQSYRDEIAASGKDYVSRYWLEAVSYKEKAMAETTEESAAPAEEQPADDQAPANDEATAPEGTEGE